MRTELRRALGTSGYPQMLLPFGYAAKAAALPRLPVEEVLDLTNR